MLHPEQDLADRTPVWDCFQDLYMDTDVRLSYDFIVRICSDSKYSIEELEEILFNEVLPSFRFNMYLIPAPEWAGLETEFVIKRVLSKHRFGKRRPWRLRIYTNKHWKILKSKILEAREVL